MGFKRRVLGKTDYKGRMEMLKSSMPRLVVRKSLRFIRAQVIEAGEKGDKTLLSANSGSLRKIGWQFSCDSIPAAYLTGLAIGKHALKNNIKGMILDTGLYKSTKGNRIYAVAKGVKDSGVEINLGEEVVPGEDRISGQHIAKSNEKFKDLTSNFSKIKETILKGA